MDRLQGEADMLVSKARETERPAQWLRPAA
jgi:hypothetical protein